MATTQTTSSTTTTTEVTYIRYESGYLRTIPGILKIVCIVLNLIGFICIQSSAFHYLSRGSFFSSMAMLGFWFSGIMLLLYLFQVVLRFNNVPWFKIEMYVCAFLTIMLLLAAILCAAASYDGSYIAAAFFGFCAMFAYGLDTFLKFRLVRSGTVVTRTTIIVA